MVDALENIAVGKLAALCGRGYPRDFVDVYFLLQENFEFQRLVALLKIKDPGVYDGYIAEMLRQVAKFGLKHMPNTLKPLDVEKLKQVFLALADELSPAQASERRT